MKVTVAILTVLVGITTAFVAPSTTSTSSVAMNAEAGDRRAFLGAAASAAALFVGPAMANAGTMAQELVLDPTEVWETGKPDPEALKKRIERARSVRSQMDSSFPPQKRLTLERKSPVTRLDINAPGFEVYRKTYPGLFKKLPKKEEEEEEVVVESSE